MCRLFGLYANKLVGVEFSFFEAKKSIEQLSRSNPNGWGVAWFDGRKWCLHKEPRPLYESESAREHVKAVRGIIVISHVRFATHGGCRVENTHPWLYRGRFVFAHNGYLEREALLDLLLPEYRDLEGETDSEVFFHLLVQEAERVCDFVEGVVRAVDKINQAGITFSSLNFIASNGENLYALRYARDAPDYYTLHYLERPREALYIEKISEKTTQLIRMKLARGEKALIVTSEPLTEEKWVEIPNNHLLIVNKDLKSKLVEIS